MANDNLKELVSQGLAAMKAGSDVAAKATDEINNDAQNADLKAALEQGNSTSKQWAQGIEQAHQQAGGGGENENMVLQAHYEVSKKIRAKAPDAQSRDLGIIASGQMALHYWIASFGTMASYTRQLGMNDIAENMKRFADEAKQADEKMTGIAQSILQQG